MSTLHLLRGLPASGKTTLARELVAAQPRGRAIRLNRDDLRRSLVDPDYRAPEPVVEKRITAVQRTSARQALVDGVDVVVDDTNLRAKYAREWATLAAHAGAELTVHDVRTPLEECIRRDAMRVGVAQVGRKVIEDMHARFLAQHGDNPWPALVAAATPPAATAAVYEPPIGRPRAIMVDIDGTVALHDGIRSPYDPSRYHLDLPNQRVIEIVERLAWAGEMSVRVIFCSGRDETYRDVTEQWLWNHVRLPFNTELHMRPAGDTRNDAVVKLELFDQHIRDHYQVVAVLDDRDRVVRAWRSIGLTVLQVAEGDF